MKTTKKEIADNVKVMRKGFDGFSYSIYKDFGGVVVNGNGIIFGYASLEITYGREMWIVDKKIDSKKDFVDFIQETLKAVKK